MALAHIDTAAVNTTSEAVDNIIDQQQAKSWRDVLPVHPAAEIFPMMLENELRELGEDIKRNGLQSPIVIFDGGNNHTLLDGRNRLNAMELVGIQFELKFGKHRRGLPPYWILHSDELFGSTTVKVPSYAHQSAAPDAGVIAVIQTV